MDAALEPGQPSASRPELDLERIAQLLRPLGSPVRLRLLRFLTQPHYMEEVASALRLSRQAARKHLDKLVAIGVLEKRPGVRASGPVTEYVINPQALFLIHDEFEKLGTLRPRRSDQAMVRTLAEPGRGAPAQDPGGPCFSIVRGFNVGQRVPLAPPRREWVLGRDQRCDVVLAHDPFASNRQAEVSLVAGRFVLTDLRSTNGTEHNWGRLPRGGSVTLRHGDLVGIGKTLLLFWDGPSGGAPAGGR